MLYNILLYNKVKGNSSWIMFSNLFSGAKTKEHVGISLNVNGLLEVIQTSKSNNEITKYTNRFVNYNAITREVESYDIFKAELEGAFEELNLNPKDCLVTVSLPNVLFGIKELPALLTDDEISNVIISEAEESYIFKRVEPVVSWAKIGNNEDMVEIAYSALQSQALKEIKNICLDLGLTLISVQNSISELFAGLNYSELTKKIIPSDKSAWNLLLISANSYSIFNFHGDKLNAYYEEPLAVKSFTSEEVYGAVGSMATTALQSYPATNLLIISETDEISAEVISSQINSSSIPFYVEQNKYQQQPVLRTSFNVLPGYISQITIAAVGASVDYFENRAIKFNYLTSDKAGLQTGDLVTIGDYSFEITKEIATKLTIIVIVALVIILGGVGLILNFAIKGTQSKILQLTEEENTLKAELSSSNANKGATNIEGTIESITKGNRKKMLYYDALSYGIPEKLWIESFYAGSGNAISIYGVSADSNDIAAFLKGIREVAGESEVSVVKLSVTGSDELFNSNEPELYSFILANKAYQSLLESSVENVDKKDANANNQKQTATNKKQQPKYSGNNIPPVNSQTSMPPVIPAE